MLLISVTADTTHADKSWSKSQACLNILCMSVTADTSHDAIGPCEPLEQSPTGDRSMHALIASLSSVLFWGANAAAKATNHSEPACLACAHGGGTRHLLFYLVFIRCDGHLPLQEIGEIKRAANENDNTVIPICELLYIYV